MRRPLVMVTLAVALGVTCILSLFLGSRPNGVADVVEVLVGQGEPTWPMWSNRGFRAP